MKNFRNRKYSVIFPSAFTLGNLLCGFLAIINASHGTKEGFVASAWWIIIAAIFDALDGKIARFTGSSSEFGIEFDSLADVVSFGVAPAIMFYFYALSDFGVIGYFPAFCFLAAGAMRLARFNVTATTGKKGYFTGMPIPSAAGILASFVLFNENVWSGLANLEFYITLLLTTSFAMLSTFKYEVLPRISFSRKTETIKSVLFIALIISIIRYPDEIFFPTGILYLLSGPFRYFAAPAFNFVFHKAQNR